MHIQAVGNKNKALKASSKLKTSSNRSFLSFHNGIHPLLQR